MHSTFLQKIRISIFSFDMASFATSIKLTTKIFCRNRSSHFFYRIFAIYIMAIDKRTSFSQIDQNLALFCKALSHPARIAILRYLAEQNSCICGDIVEELPLAQSTVSQHLKELQNAGLIKGEIEGPKTCYCVDLDHYNEMSEQLDEYLSNIKKLNLNNCC